MEDSRRQFLKIAGVAALGMGTARVIDAVAAAEEHGAQPHVRKGDDALTATQWGMVIDTAKLDHERIERMIEACHTAHNVPYITAAKVGEKVATRQEIKWIWETHFHNAFPGLGSNYMDEEVEERPFLVLCNHCEEPPCVQACPTQATFKRADGIVMMDLSPLHRLPVLYGGLSLWIAQLQSPRSATLHRQTQSEIPHPHQGRRRKMQLLRRASGGGTNARLCGSFRGGRGLRRFGGPAL